VAEDSSYSGRALAQEFIRRFGDKATLPKEVKPPVIKRSFGFIERDLFKQQIDFIKDPSKLKAAVCSRRAGKTYATCFYLLQEATRLEESICVYIGLTRITAKRLMWRELKHANRRYGLKMHFNNAELVATMPNGSLIVLAGVNDENDIDKLRGSAYRLVVLDESASFGSHIDTLVEEVLEPALIDHDGTLAMIGTPSHHCSGVFHDATTNPRSGFSSHHWTILDNPHIPHAEKWLKDRRARRGWSENHSGYRREWLGQWVKDDSTLLYPSFCHKKDTYEDLPFEDNVWCLGVDIGYNDKTAFCVAAYADDEADDRFYVHECYGRSKMTISDIAEELEVLCRRFDFSFMVADAGALGKMIVEEIRTRHGFPLEAAEKQRKKDYITLLSDDFECGKVKIRSDLDDLKSQIVTTAWNEKRTREDERYECDMLDAMLYAHRHSRHYYNPSKAEDPLTDFEAEERRFLEHLREEVSCDDDLFSDNYEGSDLWEIMTRL
jgi:hypothetical protein